MELPSFEKSQNIGQFISSLYDLAIGFVGLAVFIQFMRAGIAYFFAAGNAGDTHHAKEMMKNAVLGAILLLSAYLILNVINPDLVNMNVFDLNAIKQKIGPAPGRSIIPRDTTFFGDKQENGEAAKAELGSAGFVVDIPGESLNGVTTYMVDELKKIKKLCGCDIAITGFKSSSSGNAVTISSERFFSDYIVRLDIEQAGSGNIWQDANATYTSSGETIWTVRTATTVR